MAPGTIGSFSEFKSILMSKTTTILSIDLPFCEAYSIDISVDIAQSRLDQEDPKMRLFAEQAADAYMK